MIDYWCAIAAFQTICRIEFQAIVLCCKIIFQRKNHYHFCHFKNLIEIQMNTVFFNLLISFIVHLFLLKKSVDHTKMSDKSSMTVISAKTFIENNAWNFLGKKTL